MMGATSVKRNSFVLPAILLCAVLAVYYPVLSARFISLDDYEMLVSLSIFEDNGNWSYSQLFFPSGTERYYRPFHILSFMLDHFIWQQEASGYHLTNYLIHGLNSLLFFSILNSLSERFHLKNYYVLPGALLFALHPLTCESVAWVSGRTDLIASLFCFAAFRFYLTKSALRYLIVPVGLLLGLLAKESALAFAPILLLSDFALNSSQNKSGKEKIRSLLYWTFILLLALTSYIMMRTGGLFHLDHGTQNALANKVASGNETLSGNAISFFLHFFASIAFYLKKLFIPFPLNFAIGQIAVLPYFVFFLICCVFMGYLLLRKKYALPFWVIVIIVSFFPALLVATSKLAWTPYAERYLYLSCSIWGAAMIWTGATLVEDKLIRQSFFQVALWSIVVIWGVTTFQRTFVWQNDLSLWEETIQQSPNFGKSLYKYGEALVAAGNKEAGLAMIRRAANTQVNKDFKSLALIRLGKQALNEKKEHEALQYFQDALAVQPDRYSHEALAQFYSNSATITDETNNNFQEAIFHYEQVYMLTHDAFYLQLIARKLISHNPGEARKRFVEIIERHPRSIYAELAKKHLKTLNINAGKE
jgi:tetratricopeptide (TPR) repeat protein